MEKELMEELMANAEKCFSKAKTEMIANLAKQLEKYLNLACDITRDHSYVVSLIYPSCHALTIDDEELKRIAVLIFAFSMILEGVKYVIEYDTLGCVFEIKITDQY